MIACASDSRGLTKGNKLHARHVHTYIVRGAKNFQNIVDVLLSVLHEFFVVFVLIVRFAKRCGKSFYKLTAR